MTHLRAFIAGFLATLIFHQGLLALLHIAGILPITPYRMSPTEPLGVPAVFSLAFWGGVWGIVLWLLVRGRRGAARWWWSLAIGAIGPTAVALLVVFPLKGIAVSLGMIPVGMTLNGVWGLGTLVCIDALRRVGLR